MSRRFGVAIAAAVLAAFVGGCGAVEAPPEAGAESARHVDDAWAVLERNGFSLGVPPGWDGRILFSDAAGASHVLFQVANFELPVNEGLEPPPRLPPGQEDPIKAMGEGDVLLMLQTDAPAGDPAPETISLDRLELLPPGTPRVPVGHTLAHGAYCRLGRCFGIEVDFGGRSPTLDLREHVNRVLASLRVESR